MAFASKKVPWSSLNSSLNSRCVSQSHAFLCYYCFKKGFFGGFPPTVPYICLPVSYSTSRLCQLPTPLTSTPPLCKDQSCRRCWGVLWAVHLDTAWLWCSFMAWFGMLKKGIVCISYSNSWHLARCTQIAMPSLVSIVRGGGCSHGRLQKNSLLFHDLEGCPIWENGEVLY